MNIEKFINTIADELEYTERCYDNADSVPMLNYWSGYIQALGYVTKVLSDCINESE